MIHGAVIPTGLQVPEVICKCDGLVFITCIPPGLACE